jgi:hypothetical protein
MKKQRCVPLFSLLFLIALLIGLYFVPAVISQKSGTERTTEYNDDGQLVNVERIHDNDLLVEKKEFDIRTDKLRRRITYKYLKGFKQADTSTTNYQPDGKTPQSTTNVDHDKDGNTTSTITTNYDETGKETGGSKRERDPKTGKERCYNWNPGKQVYEEVECPKKPWVSSVGDNAKVETGGGLIKVNFNVEGGRVIVNLPDDMMAGDTISGTVVAEPKGQTPEERTKNLTDLNGYVVELETPKQPNGTSNPKVEAKVTINLSPFTVILPQTTTPSAPLTNVTYQMTVNLKNELSNLVFSKPVDVMAENSLNSLRPISVENRIYEIPTIGQQGRPIEIIGPFDGNTTNTKLMYGPKGSSIPDFEKNTENVTGGFGLLQPLAESPRRCVLTAPTNVTGPIELFVKDGQTQTTSPYRNVGVNLSAPKTNLLKGEHTELHVEVNGLQGIDKPVPLTLQSNGVITVEGGMYQPLVIQPSQVGADGRYTMARGITGVQAGGWSATVTVVTQPFNIVLRDPDPPQTVLINSFTGDYVFCGSNVKLSGTGEIKLNGNALTLTDNKPDRQVQGVFRFESTRQLYFPVESLRSPGTTVNIQSTVTESKPPRTRVYFNPLGRPAPPVQDVSAFATCP